MIRLLKTHYEVQDRFTAIVDGKAYCCDEQGVLWKYIGKVRKSNGHLYLTLPNSVVMNADDMGREVPLSDFPGIAEKVGAAKCGL